MKCIPSPHLLRSICQQNLSVKIALSEWIDNSLDAGAMTIAIVFAYTKHSKNAKPEVYVSVADNGRGADSLASFTTLGGHSRHRTTRSGQYGIGSKDAALWLGGESCRLTVKSTCAGKRRGIEVDWAAILASGDWEFPDPSERDVEPGDPVGTTIVVMPVNRKVPEGRGWEDLVKDLAYIYTPALKRGAQISVCSKARGSTPEMLQPWKLPRLAPGHVDTTIVVGGKSARVYAGVVAEGEPNEKPGLTYMHGFRVLEPACSKGCGGHSVANIAGFVEIDDSWTRHKNKDGIQDADALHEAVAVALREVLERGERVGAQLESAAFTTSVESLLNAAMGDPDTKAKRGAGDKEGARKPTGKGARHRRAAKEQDGATFVRQRHGRIRLGWTRLGIADHLGEVRGDEVLLNLDNPFLAHAKQESNASTVVFAAFTLISSEVCFHGGSQLKLRAIDESDAVNKLARTIGGLLARPTSMNGVVVAAPPLLACATEAA